MKIFLNIIHQNVHVIKDTTVVFVNVVWDKTLEPDVEMSDITCRKLIITPDRIKFCIIIPPSKVIVRKWCRLVSQKSLVFGLIKCATKSSKKYPS
jgi:hypothetical protein